MCGWSKVHLGWITPSDTSALDTMHVDGTIVKVSGDPDVFMLNGGKKYKFPNMDVFLEFGHLIEDIIEITTSEMQNYIEGNIFKYRSGELLKSDTEPHIYLVEDFQLRKISSMTIFDSLGYSLSNINEVAQSVIDAFVAGNVVADSTVHTNGALVKTATNDNVYIINLDKKQLIPSIDHFNDFGYDTAKILEITDLEMNGYTEGPPWLFYDGTPIKSNSNPDVYILVLQKRRHITSQETFDKLNYSPAAVRGMNVIETYDVDANLSSFFLRDVKTNFNILKMKVNPLNSDEYFLAENRQKSGFDTFLPGSGLFIWHIDDSLFGTNQQSNEAHKGVDLEEADGQNHLDNKTNKGDAGDPFPGSSSNVRFDDFTTPDAEYYTNGNSGLIIADIAENNGLISFNIE